MQAVTTIVPEIKQQYNLKICACLGLLTPEQAQQLKECGVDRVNHNLNTSEKYYGEICTTHTFGDRLATLRAVRDAGMEMCSGGIIGMGERREDVVDLAHHASRLGRAIDPGQFPESDRRHAAGRTQRSQSALLPEGAGDVPARESRSRAANCRRTRAAPWQLASTGLYAANSIFVGDYLTTKGQPPEADYQMIRDLGFEVVRNAECRIASQSLRAGRQRIRTLRLSHLINRNSLRIR